MRTTLGLRRGCYMKRSQVPDESLAEVLTASRRRCCICFGLHGDDAQKAGQVAHNDHDPSNNHFDNLAFLCLEHHDKYDSRTSQSKGFTIAEVKRYRTELLSHVARIPKTAGTPEPLEYAEFEIIGQFGVVQTVYVSPPGLGDRFFVAQVLHAISSKVSTGSILEILVFDDRNFTPQGLPMTDEQMKHFRARYNRNPNTGLDRFAWVRVVDANSSPPGLAESDDSIRPGDAGDA